MSRLQKELTDLPYGGQSELARKMGVTPQTVNKWAQGVTYPSRAHLEVLANELSIPLEELIATPNRVGGASRTSGGRGGRVASLSDALQDHIRRITSDLPGIVARTDLDEDDREMIKLALKKMIKSTKELEHGLSQILKQLENEG